LVATRWQWGNEADAGSLYFGGDSLLHNFAEFDGADVRVLEGIRDSGGPLRLPLLVAPVAGSYSEAFSPYGYTSMPRGPALTLDEVSTLTLFLKKQQVIDLFLRHNPWQESQEILAPDFSVQAGVAFSLNIGGFHSQVTNDLTRVPQKRRSTLRKALSGNLKVRVTLASEATPEQRTSFQVIYLKTMAHSGARKFYKFDTQFFLRLFEEASESLLLFEAEENDTGATVATALFIGGDDSYLHYFLSGTLAEARSSHAVDLIIFRAAQYFSERGYSYMNLGGATAFSGDGLRTFKKNWSTQEHPYFISKLICDDEAYYRLRSDIGIRDDTIFLLRDLRQLEIA
jgi:hypothetical protein